MMMIYVIHCIDHGVLLQRRLSQKTTAPVLSIFYVSLLAQAIKDEA